jgi:hypothetical protein
MNRTIQFEIYVLFVLIHSYPLSYPLMKILFQSMDKKTNLSLREIINSIQKLSWNLSLERNLTIFQI